MWPRSKRKNRRCQRRHVLQVKLRSSQRRRAHLRKLAFLLLFVTSVGLGFLAVQYGGTWVVAKLIKENQVFKIQHLDIQTDGVLAVEQLRRWAGVDLEDNIFVLDLERVKRDLELVPVIRSATVERVLPHTLRIRVVERDPVLQAEYPERGQCYLLDSQGYVMFPRDAYQLAESVALRDKQLPRLAGIPESSMRPGQRLGSEQVHAAIGLVRAFASSPMMGVAQLREVDVRRPGVLLARTDLDCEVTFGLSGFEQQLRRWHAIHERGRHAGQELARLDLSVSNNIPARWRQVNLAGDQ